MPISKGHRDALLLVVSYGIEPETAYKPITSKWALIETWLKLEMTIYDKMYENLII